MRRPDFMAPPRGPVGGNYPIYSRKKRKDGSRQRLSFFWRNENVNVLTPGITHHGVHAVGWVRRQNAHMKTAMAASVAEWRRRGVPPTRKEMVETINQHIRAAFAKVVANTPTAAFPENRNATSVPYVPLKDAWSLVLAR